MSRSPVLSSLPQDHSEAAHTHLGHAAPVSREVGASFIGRIAAHSRRLRDSIGPMDASRMDEPAAVADLVAYQSGAVVSQTLVKERSGTVTVFAFDAGEGLSEHEAPFDALLFLIEGRATVRVGGKDHAISGGQIVRLPARVPHAVQAVDRFKMLLIMIRDGGPPA